MSVQEVSANGTSIWLDDLSRAKITSTEPHALPARIQNSGVVGVTTNPSIFSAAISGAAEYAADIALMKGSSVVVRRSCESGRAQQKQRRTTQLLCEAALISTQQSAKRFTESCVSCGV